MRRNPLGMIPEIRSWKSRKNNVLKLDELQKNHPLLVFLMEILLLRILCALLIPLTGDEAYHIEWARHLDWCYYDHPGMVAWIMKPFLFFFGEGLLSVRFQAVMSGILFAAAAYSLGRDMFPGTDTGKRAAIVTVLVPVAAVISLLVSTDTPLTVFWAFALVYFYRASENNRMRDWVITGVLLGGAFLSKFLAFGFLPAAFCFLLVSREKRKLLKTPGPWVALGLTLVLFIPVIAWNASHDWLTFKFNFVSRQQSLSFSPKTFVFYLLGQLFFFSPVIAGFFLIKGVVSFKDHFSDDRKLFLLLFAGVPLGGFMFISFFREVGGHWPAMALVPLCIYFAAYAGRGKLYKTGFAIGTGLSVLVILVVGSLLLSGPERVESLAQKVMKNEKRAVKFVGQVFYEDEIAGFAGFLREFKDGFSATESYSLSSMLTYYDPQKSHYLLWASESFYGRNYYLWDDLNDYKGRTMVFVCFRKWLDAEFLKHMLLHFKWITIHYFHEGDTEGMLKSLATDKLSGTVHTAPRGMGAFAIIVGEGFSGEEMKRE